MISAELNNISNYLAELQVLCDKYYPLSRDDMFTRCIDERLVKTLRLYNEEIDVTERLLLQKESERVLKAITKLRKFDDRDIIRSNLQEVPNERPYI